MKRNRALLVLAVAVVFFFGLGLGISDNASAENSRCCWFVNPGCDTTWGVVVGPGCSCHPIDTTWGCRIECGGCY
jgi:hypothetical protein